MSCGYTDAIKRAIAAKKQSDKAKALLKSLEQDPDSDDETAECYCFPPKEASSPPAIFLRIFWIGVFISVGVFFYAEIGRVREWDSGGEPWSRTQAVYFAVVTMSTVGYGDLTVSQERWEAPAFTVMYILVGVLVVFQFAGQLYDSIFHT